MRGALVSCHSKSALMAYKSNLPIPLGFRPAPCKPALSIDKHRLVECPPSYIASEGVDLW